MAKQTRAKKILCGVLAILMFVSGIIVYAYPYVNQAITKSNSAETLENFRFVRSAYNDAEDAPIEDDLGNIKKTDAQIDAAQLTEEERSVYDRSLFDELKSAMTDYNKKIYEEKQTGLKDAWSYEQAEFDLTRFGIRNNVVAELRVPAMDVDMPLYLGATWSNMAWGAVQMGQTSMPIGGKNTNCVIAGHRGCTNGRYFLDIENMRLGDKVYIDNLWETLTYKVTEIKIISPEDISEILIQDGKDMVTLITCHPYPNNYQRYVVYCERTANDKNSGSANAADKANNNAGSPDNNSGANNGENEDNFSVENSSVSFIEFENTLKSVVPIINGVLLIASIVIIVYSRRKYREK